MCGIIGYVGQRDARMRLLAGLAALEYRGYDSAGICLATPDGLAVAFRNTQPLSVPRTLQRVQRDFSEQVDRVSLIVDFDGDHRTGYHFMVSSTDGIADSIVTNENSFNYDWDGNWRHATSLDDEGWTVELLIPWHIAPMRDATDKLEPIQLSRTGYGGELGAVPDGLDSRRRCRGRRSGDPLPRCDRRPS